MLGNPGGRQLFSIFDVWTRWTKERLNCGNTRSDGVRGVRPGRKKQPSRHLMESDVQKKFKVNMNIRSDKEFTTVLISIFLPVSEMSLVEKKEKRWKLQLTLLI